MAQGTPDNARESRGGGSKIPLRERVRWHIKRRVAETQGKVEQPRRDRFFSEAHPHLYAGISTLLPRLHTAILLCVIGYFIIKELLHGNLGFAVQWYYASPLPTLVMILTDEDLLKAYLPVIAMIVMLMLMMLFTIYMLPWRMAFKDYKRVIVNNWRDRLEITPVPEGRLYWRTDNMWYQLWDAWYQSPERRTVKIYLHRGWWPPLNILNPPSSMICVELSREERLEQRGVFEVHGHEKPYRWRSGLREYRTRDAPYDTKESPLDTTQVLFDDGVTRIVGEMRDLTNANAAIRLKQMASQTYGVEEEFLKAVEEEEGGTGKERTKEATDASGKAAARP